MVKKLVSVLTVMLFLFTFSPQTQAAAATYGPWKITSYSAGDWDSVMASPNRNVTSLKINIKQYGVHSGQKADILWHVWETGTVGKTSWSKRISSDYTGTLVVNGLNPSKDYSVGWISKTNNDLSGQWSVSIDGSVTR
ncbi:hypothetical protein [Pseudobacillus badius]|uniref:hypothetical protein n=1 Tax=Bacillus badius TaxID=1455 RepID=UPI0005972CAD|nr:hypothetical protein [Bacillus badius]MED0665616.1 hypothetical protein [Bacillus badius]UAT33118.1 hypothetical protein K7T73_21845 [Bacillus badius]GLY12974.1 hypothetical protein Bbad01_41900 [Bacillus badius]